MTTPERRLLTVTTQTRRAELINADGITVADIISLAAELESKGFSGDTKIGVPGIFGGPVPVKEMTAVESA